MCILECPDEIIWIILEYLNCTDLMSVHKTCVHLYILSKPLLNSRVNTITLQKSINNDDVVGFKAVLNRQIYVYMDLIPLSVHYNAPTIFKSIIRKCNLESYTEINYIIDTILSVEMWSFLDVLINEHYRYNHCSLITKLMLSCILRKCSYPLLEEFLKKVQITHQLITPDIIYFALTYQSSKKSYNSDRSLILLLRQVSQRGWKLRYNRIRIQQCLIQRYQFASIEQSLLRSLRRTGAIIRYKNFI